MGFEFELMQFISSFSLVSRTSSILVLFFCWVLIFSAAERVCLNIINRARLFYLFTIMNCVGVSWFSMEYVWFKYITVGSQIVAHTLTETGNGPNRPNTINLWESGLKNWASSDFYNSYWGLGIWPRRLKHINELGFYVRGVRFRWF